MTTTSTRKIWINGRPNKGNVVKLNLLNGNSVVGFYLWKIGIYYVLSRSKSIDDIKKKEYYVYQDKIRSAKVIDKGRFR